MLNTISIDYLSCTFKDLEVNQVEKAMNIICNEILKIPFEKFVYFDFGYNKYNCHYAYNDIKIYFKKNLEFSNKYIINQGVFLELKGLGCSQLEEFLSTENTWIDFIERCSKYSARFTRFDIANDIYDNSLNIQQIKHFSDMGLCVTRVKRKIYHEETESTSNHLYGNSITFGRRGNDGKQWCVYDKLLEQEKNTTDYLNGWIRSELRFFGDSAQLSIKHFILSKQISELYFSTLSGFIRFVSEQEQDKNIRRRSNATWWNNYLQTEEKTYLKTQKDKKTMQKTETFVKKQAQKSISMIYERDKIVFGEEKAQMNLIKIAKDGVTKISLEDRKIIEQSAIEKLSQKSYM